MNPLTCEEVSELAGAYALGLLDADERATIEDHLAKAMEAGEPVALDRLVIPDKRRAIEAAIDEVGLARLKPIMERLGEGYTYAELRFVRAALLQAEG